MHSAGPSLPALFVEVLYPRHFFVTPRLTLALEQAPAEETSWEIFRGRLLEPSQTRQRRTFAAWNLYLVDGAQRSSEPLLSVKWDAATGQVHVTRAILCHAWEGYDAGDNVVLSRQSTRWIRELVGTLTLAEFADADELRAELVGLVFRAVIGTSRLPLTSIEAPLPGFALGEIGYFFREAATDDNVAMRSWRDLLSLALNAHLSWLEKTKLLELMLRAVSDGDLAEAADFFVHRWQAIGQQKADLPVLLRNVFREVSLSPYTAFADRTLAFLGYLVERGHLSAVERIDFLSFLLRQTARHLTAYDLITFHHRGANYPDALLLDAVLKDYLRCIERQPAVFLPESDDDEPAAVRKRIRRRALRQGSLIHHYYQGHAVPDAPTSPGENARILPAPHVAVPEEQLVNTLRRKRRLYAGDPLAGLLESNARLVLEHSLQDLREPAELRELGTAIFIERPLGRGKEVGEPDHTPILAHEAFSPSLAERRLRLLSEIPGGCEPIQPAESRSLLRQMANDGLPVQAVLPPDRPVVALTDALRVAEDFVVRRTLPSSVEDLLALFDFGPLASRLPLDFLLKEKKAVIVRIPSERSSDGTLAIYDLQMRKRLELVVNLEEGFAMRGGVEYPRAGLNHGERRVEVRLAGSQRRPRSRVAAGSPLNDG